jgi:uncharacterized membrane protein
MAPLVVLVIVTLLARLAGQWRTASLGNWAAATTCGLAGMFFFTAVAHFNSMRSDLVRMVPPAIPNPEFMVTLTGICEIVGGVGLLVPRTRRMAAIALILLLIAVVPANIHAALSGVAIRGVAATPIIPRIALQLLFIALIWWSGVHAPRSREHRKSGEESNTSRMRDSY